MRKQFLIVVVLIVTANIAKGQSPASSNTLGNSGVTAIASTTSASYKLSINGAVKQYGTGFNTVTSPTLFLHNTTASTGRHYGITSENSGLFQIVDVTASNTSRFVINGSGYIGIGTTSPSALFHTNGTVRFQGLGSQISYTKILAVDDNGNLAYRDASTLGGGGGITINSTQIAFGNVSNQLSSSSDFTWDGTKLMLGNSIGVAVTTPVSINTGATFGSNTPGTPGNLKLKLYDNNSSTVYGLGISSSVMEYQVPAGADHRFYVAGTEIMRLTSAGLESWKGNTNNVRLGGYALNAVTSGTLNVAVGFQSLSNTTTASNNIALGYQSLVNATTGGSNIALGTYASSGVISGTQNINIGGGGLSAGASYNVGVGSVALGSASGQFNVGLGQQALTSLTTGSSNIGIGYNAGGGTTTGNNNVDIGNGAGYLNNGSNNTFIGFGSGYQNTGSGNVFLGKYAGFYETGDNKLYIDNTETTTPLVYGDFTSNLFRVNGQLNVNGSAKFEGLTTNNSLTSILAADASGNLSWRDASTLGGGGGGSSQWNTAINDIYYNTGNVGIGTGSPTYKLDVNGGAHFGGNTPSTSTIITPNGDIGIGITPITNMAMQVYRDANATAGIRFENVNLGPNSFTAIQLGQDINTTGTKFLNIGYANPNIMPYGVYHAAGSFMVSYGAGGLNMSAYSTSGAPKMRFYTGNTVTDANLRMTIDENGAVGIGIATIPDGYKFAVAGNIITEKVKVKLQSSGWPDYVFHPEYELPSLKDLEIFIHKNKHLPDVPSTSDVEKNGLDLGDSQSILLKKVEELTLYIIEINKKVDKLAEENALLKKKLESNKK